MKRARRTCVLKPHGWRRRNALRQLRREKIVSDEQNLKEMRDRMKQSRKVLTHIWNQVLDFTPILNFKDDWKKGSTASSVKERRKKNDNYFFKPKRKLFNGTTIRI